jgi:D-glycero-alpha-D-manno-heptose-7-phosphate kinase
MIITKTPFRISFVGGGSDLPAFYRRSQGAVLSTTIDKFMYISSHRFFDSNKIRLKYSRTETVTSIERMKHPIAREVLKYFRVNGAIEISSNADVPAGCGLSSSSSFTVGLLHNLYTVQGKFVTKQQLAEDACRIEIDKLKEPIGKQDQYATAFGGLNVITFSPTGAVDVEPIHPSKHIYQALQDGLLLFYTGRPRKASSILSEQSHNLAHKEKFALTKKMVELVWQLRAALYEGNLDMFGRLLHTNWLLKKQLASKISDPRIDSIYETAVKNGAIGGKVLGAGGGGFMLFYCEPRKQKNLKTALSGLKHMSFRFESQGSRVIYTGDEYYDH